MLSFLREGGGEGGGSVRIFLVGITRIKELSEKRKWADQAKREMIMLMGRPSQERDMIM